MATAESTSSGVLLVVGLGNPGIEYQFTPHNAGFLAVDRIADDYRVQVANRRCRALTAKIRIAGREVILAKPETFMNLSGLSVAALVEEFEVDPLRNLLVLYDELALPLDAMRVRERGSAAGHNGAKSISGALRSDDWARIRIGVGPDATPESAFRRGKDYLLTPLRKADLATLDEVLDRVERAVEMVAAQGVKAAMNEFNGFKKDGREQNGPAE
ncbi:PTH1 family peptidyl-tRNA hydrolase [Silvibacterium bohemicum]|uniref:Peptidyl-tRNA hydrolase n=1 Tax=Silvibacterium bohemicum TaxID=1577686 RepID=A0A841JZX4_9BACT|nr:aminoacyl-tRNA hydrolase [Silvibacterium bohemicum]MBB6146912.1 PTH1 family peptidyl-tRNA hydrolase [Silvibacterium bohemicum]